MNKEFLKTVSVTETKNIIDELTNKYMKFVDTTELVDLRHSLGRTCSKSIVSNTDLPEFNRSTVDGYGTISKDIIGASDSIPSVLTLVGESKMGESIDISIKSGECVYVPTGGMIPNGVDAMVMIEDSEALDEETILINKASGVGNHITYRGDDVKVDDVLLNQGELIHSYHIALLAGMGIGKVSVIKKPVFTVLSTGDEIIDLNEEKTLGKIRDINGYGLSAWIEEHGGIVTRHGIVKDEFDKLLSTLQQSIRFSDIVLLSGGSSMGARDYTKDLIESLPGGRVLVHGMSIKPGKPTIVGEVAGKLVIGLPGHPVSAMVVCQQLVSEFLDTWFSHEKPLVKISARLRENVHGAPGKDTVQLVELVRVNGEYIANPIYGKSGLISTLAKASGYFIVDSSKEGLTAGEEVSVFLLQEVRI